MRDQVGRMVSSVVGGAGASVFAPASRAAAGRAVPTGDSPGQHVAAPARTSRSRGPRMNLAADITVGAFA